MITTINEFKAHLNQLKMVQENNDQFGSQWNSTIFSAGTC